MLIIHKVEARDLPDLWFQAVRDAVCGLPPKSEHEEPTPVTRQFKIDKGSYEGQTRLEYDYFIGHVKFPGHRPLIPDIPPHFNIPNPVEQAYIDGGDGYDRSYVEYIMTARKEPGESYTYGERLTKSRLVEDKLNWWLEAVNSETSDKHEIVDGRKVDDRTLFKIGGERGVFLNQIEWVIDTYRKHGHRNNQMVLQVAEPTDVLLKDPPCLRSIDTRIQDGKLHFIVYFRSWDLWGGLPANLAGIQHLKEYMAAEIGAEDGEMIVESKGLHIYGYAEKLAKMRCMVEENC